MPDIRNILAGVGLMLYVPGAMALLSVIVALIFQDYHGTEAFVATAVASGLSGWLLRYFFYDRDRTLNVPQIMSVATIGWMLVSLLGALPLVYLTHRLPPEAVAAHQLQPFAHLLNATFEAMSGYTSTGLTMVISESDLPPVVQWWRSFMQWVGGVGIIVFISGLHPGLTSVSAHYTDENDQKSEDTKQEEEEQEDEPDEEDEVLPNVSVSWSKIWWIYLSFTALSIGLLLAQGIPLWEAINHGMTGISTGGFSITDQSLETYTSGAKATMIFIIIVGSLNFNLYHLLFTKGNFRRFFRNQQHILFGALFAAGTLLLFYENNAWAAQSTAWIDLTFQAASALGTCGFSTVSLSNWPSTSLLVLTMAMLIGGATASTTGGIKLFRIILLVKGSIYNTLFWDKADDRTLNFHFNDEVFSQDESLRLYRNIGTFSFYWITFYLLATFVLLHEAPAEYTLTSVIFEAASAFGTVGLSTGITDHTLSAVGKVDLMLAMLVGRLEIMPLALLVIMLWRRRI